jgi:hypothetical protein
MNAVRNTLRVPGTRSDKAMTMRWNFRRLLRLDYRQSLEKATLRFFRILSRAMMGMSPWK